MTQVKNNLQIFTFAVLPAGGRGGAKEATAQAASVAWAGLKHLNDVF